MTKADRRKMIDYIAMMQEYFGRRNDGFFTDAPKPIQLAEDDFIRVHYDAKAMSSPTPKAYGAGYRLDHRGLSIQRQGS